VLDRLTFAFVVRRSQIRIIKDDPRVKLANQVNLASALRVALLTLPENFSERELYTRIAGLSYGGESSSETFPLPFLPSLGELSFSSLREEEEG